MKRSHSGPWVKSESWPYPAWVYLIRALWLFIQGTIWKLCWGRIYVLRPLLLRIFGAKVSLKSQVDSGVQVEIPWLLQSGDYVSIGPRVRIYNLGGIRIGNHVIISQDAYLCGGTHDYRDQRMPLVRREIVIKDKAWICAGAFIGPGVTIGEGAVVGARACVMKEVPPWTVVAGNPARVVKKRRMGRTSLQKDSK